MRIDLYLNIDEIIQHFNNDKNCTIRIYSYGYVDVVPYKSIKHGNNIIYTIDLFSDDYKQVGDYKIYVDWLRDCFDNEFLVEHSNNDFSTNQYIVKINLI